MAKNNIARIYFKFMTMKWQDYIGTEKDILVGKPIIKGTRISIDFLIGLLAQGWTEEQILENYPRLTKESLKALFLYIQECLEDNLLLPAN